MWLRKTCGEEVKRIHQGLCNINFYIVKNINHYFYTMQTWEFQKRDVPQDQEEKLEFAKSLEEHGVSLVDYMKNLTDDM